MLKTRLLQKDIRDLGQCYGIGNTRPNILEEQIKEVILQEQLQVNDIANIKITCHGKQYNEAFKYLRNGYFKRLK